MLLFIYLYLFLAVLGLCYCARAFSSCDERGPLFIAVHGPLTAAASPVAEHRLQMHRLSSCGSRAQLLRSMLDLPRPGLEPVSPALAGRFSTTAPPGKPQKCFQNHTFFQFLSNKTQSSRQKQPIDPTLSPSSDLSNEHLTAPFFFPFLDLRSESPTPPLPFCIPFPSLGTLRRKSFQPQ